MPAVSVIVPVYNVEPYIARCARSLFGQTLKDMEFIFIDDCTPDRSMEILQEVLEEFPDRKPQVRCLRMPQNSGLAAVRYKSYMMATGDYVIACDSDDDVSPDAYRTMYEKAVSGDYDMVVCDFYLVRDGKVIPRSQYAPEGKEVDSILGGKTMGSVWCRLIRRSLLDGIFPAVGNMTEDLVITVQTACKACRIGYVRAPLYYYYLKPSSISMEAGEEADLARWRDAYANARVLVDWLVNSYGMDNNHPALIRYKYMVRSHLKRRVQDPEIYHKWQQTFPEIDRRYLLTPGISFGEKFWFVLIHIHLYYPWKRMTGLLRGRD